MDYQLSIKEIQRKYLAIVKGKLTGYTQHSICQPIGRDRHHNQRMIVSSSGKRACTYYQCIATNQDLSVVECTLDTGRKHQIRVHMASIGHPLLGDALYGPAKCPYQLQGQTLHAYVLGFIHPSTGEYMEFQAPLPDYFEDLLKKLRQSSAG